MSYALAFLVSLVYIFLKAAQQLHVMHMEFRRIMPTSLGMAACEVFILHTIVRTADSLSGLVILALSIGLGAGIGCIAAMRLHLRRKACASESAKC